MTVTVEWRLKGQSRWHEGFNIHATLVRGGHFGVWVGYRSPEVKNAQFRMSALARGSYALTDGRTPWVYWTIT